MNPEYAKRRKRKYIKSGGAFCYPRSGAVKLGMFYT